MTGRKHSRTLFLDSEGAPLKFYMRPCNEKVTLKPLIEHGGGTFVGKLSRDAIHLLEPGSKVISIKDDVIKIPSKYIFDCVQQNRQLDMEMYKIKNPPCPKEDVSDDDFIPSDAESFNMRLPVKKKNSCKRKDYSVTEEYEIINYIIRANRYGDVKGNHLWKCMEYAKVLDTRSWQSMKGRFVKKILPNISDYEITEKQKKNFRKMHSAQSDDVSSVSSYFNKSYTLQEDNSMLHYIIKENKIREVKGTLLWKEMESLKVTAHTWQSMKERFIKRIIPNLNRYEISLHKAKELATIIHIPSHILESIQTRPTLKTDSFNKRPLQSEFNFESSKKFKQNGDDDKSKNDFIEKHGQAEVLKENLLMHQKRHSNVGSDSDSSSTNESVSAQKQNELSAIMNKNNSVLELEEKYEQKEILKKSSFKEKNDSSDDEIYENQSRNLDNTDSESMDEEEILPRKLNDQQKRSSKVVAQGKLPAVIEGCNLQNEICEEAKICDEEIDLFAPLDECDIQILKKLLQEMKQKAQAKNCDVLEDINSRSDILLNSTSETSLLHCLYCTARELVKDVNKSWSDASQDISSDSKESADSNFCECSQENPITALTKVTLNSPKFDSAKDLRPNEKTGDDQEDSISSESSLNFCEKKEEIHNIDSHNKTFQKCKSSLTNPSESENILDNNCLRNIQSIFCGSEIIKTAESTARNLTDGGVLCQCENVVSSSADVQQNLSDRNPRKFSELIVCNLEKILKENSDPNKEELPFLQRFHCDESIDYVENSLILAQDILDFTNPKDFVSSSSYRHLQNKIKCLKANLYKYLLMQKAASILKLDKKGLTNNDYAVLIKAVSLQSKIPFQDILDSFNV